MVSGRTHRSGTARLLAVCALLLGLFAMHGLPASAADGCHAQMAAAAVPVMADGADGMAPAPAEHAAAAGHTDGLPGGAQLHHGAEAKQGGSLCVSTLGRDRLVLTALDLIAVVALWSATGPAVPRRVAAFLVRRRRGPPMAGRSLLHHVCVART